MLMALDYTCDEVEAEAEVETERAFQCDTNRSNKDEEISGNSTQIGGRRDGRFRCSLVFVSAQNVGR